MSQFCSNRCNYFDPASFSKHPKPHTQAKLRMAITWTIGNKLNHREKNVQVKNDFKKLYVDILALAKSETLVNV